MKSKIAGFVQDANPKAKDVQKLSTKNRVYRIPSKHREEGDRRSLHFIFQSMDLKKEANIDAIVLKMRTSSPCRGLIANATWKKLFFCRFYERGYAGGSEFFSAVAGWLERELASDRREFFAALHLFDVVEQRHRSWAYVDTACISLLYIRVNSTVENIRFQNSIKRPEHV